jgi:PAS domain S-box-containing protein
VQPTRPPRSFYALVAMAAAFALPQSTDLNPLAESGYFALALAATVAAARLWGLQPGMQVAMLGTLLSNVILPRNDPLEPTGAQLGIYILAALVIGSFKYNRPKAKPAAPPKPPLLEAAGDAILVADAEGRCIDANAAMAELLGYPPPELLERRAQELIERRRPFTAAERAALADHGRWRGDLTLHRQDGSSLVVDARLLILDLPSKSFYLTVVPRKRRQPA